MPKTIKEIILDYLKKNGYDGLYYEHQNCQCTVKDLMPCHNPEILNCLPGHKHLKNDGDWEIGK